MNKHLIVRGFGVEIKSAKPPEKIYICTRQIPSESSLKRVDYNHFGTRHRSMMRYCWNYSGAVGFVVSQDGDVRAMTKYDDKLIIWDNIRLQAYTFVSRKLIRRKRIKEQGNRFVKWSAHEIMRLVPAQKVNTTLISAI